MDNILKQLRDDEIDTLVQFKANGMTLSTDTKTDHLSDDALDYMSKLKSTATVPVQEVKPQVNFNDIGNVHPAPAPAPVMTKEEQGKKRIEKIQDGVTELITTPVTNAVKKFKQWWNDDETINHNSQINNDDRYKVSQLSNPQDTTFTGMIGDITGIDSIKEAGKRTYTKDDISNYQTSVENALADKYDLQFDEKSGLPSARLKGTTNKYEPILNDVGDASFEEIEQRVKANATQLAAEIGLDIAGGYQGIKYASKFTKNPALLVIAGGTGATVGSGIGAGAGATIQSLQSGEEITTKRLGNKAFEEAQDAIVGNVLALGAIGVVDVTWKGLKKVNPIHSVKGGKNSYLEKDLYEVEQTGAFSSTKTIDKREEQLADIAKQKAQAEDVYLDFGGKMEESEVMELVGQTNTKEILGNHYNHSQERINAEIQNSIQLTKNFKSKFNLSDTQSADLYRMARGGMKRVKKYYSNLYKNSKQLIEDEIGDTFVKVSSDTQKRLDELLLVAKHPTNVSNTLIEEPVKNKFNKDYQNLLNLTNSYFEDTAGFTVKKLFEVQKTFNTFTNKHSDKFTYEQLESLGTIKDAIYKDINKGIKVNVPETKLQKQFIDLWANANKEYKNYTKLIQREDVLKKLLDRDNKFDVKKFTEDIFKDINKVSHDDINILAVFGREIKKTQGEDALDEFHSAILNGLLKAKTVNVNTGETAAGIMQTITHKNKSVEIMNFDAFHKMFTDIDEKQLNKIFSGSTRGKQILYHLKNFDKLAQRESILQQNLIGTEFKYAESAMQEHEIGKIAYSTAFGLKFGAWRWLSKNVIRSKAYEDFLLRAITKPRYEDIDSAIKKLAYDQKNTPPMQKVDIESLRADLRAMKEVNKKAEEYIKTKPEATKEEIEQVTISGILEHKPFNQGRNFDVEKVQAKELAHQNGMPEDIVERINNFDELGREIKSFSEANKEIFNAHKINPPVKNSDDVLIKPDPVHEEIEKEDFKQFLSDAGVKDVSDIDVGDIPQTPINTDMMSQAMNKQKFMSELELRVYNEPPLAQISQDDKMLYKQYEKMFTTFQGGKSELSKIIPQYTQKAFTQEQRANVTVINDYFGGGGTRGAFFGRLTHQFPNVKTLNIHEFSGLRAMKINYLHHKPQALIDTLENDKYIKDLLEGMRKISIEKGNKGSHGFVAPYINKMLEQYKKGDAVQTLTDDQIATLYLVADYAARSVKTIDSTLTLLANQVKGVAQQIAQLKARGVDIKVFNHSSYDDIAQYEQGSHVLSMIDPPYYKTSGYDIFNGDKLIKSEIVDVDLYEKTATLIKNIKEAGNLGIYTDEAWEVKSVKLSKNFKTVTNGGQTDYEVLKDISDNIEYFFRVPENIAKGSDGVGRTEVLGLINAKGKIDDRYTSSRPNGPNSNNGGTKTIDGSNRGSENTPTRAMERPDKAVSEDSTKASQGTSTSPARRQEPTRRPQEVVEPRVDFEVKAKELNQNPPSFDELKALENLEGGLSFSQNVFIPLREKKINSVGAEAYLKALATHKENLPRAIQEVKYPVNEINIAKLERLRGYFKTNKEIHGDKDGFGTVANPNQFKALIYDLKKHGKIQRATQAQNKEYENLYYELQEMYDELAPQIDEMYNESLEESIIPFAKFGDNLLAGTIAGVQTDDDGNITGFDPESFIVGMGGYTAAKHGAKYLIKKYKPQEKIADKIQKFIDHAEDEMGKMAGGGKPPVMAKEFKDDQGFYSVLEKVVDEKVGGKIDTVSLTKMLEKNGVKQDELEWSGLKELIENNDKLTKGQIEETISENRLVVEVLEQTNSKWHKTAPKDKYVLPNGKEYKELLFTMPKSKDDYISEHFDESNILVFTRVDDRNIDDKKALFIEELQSDWHQAGRKEGYITEQSDEVKKLIEELEFKMQTFNMEEKEFIEYESKIIKLVGKDEAKNIIDKIDLHGDKKLIPNAPFKKNWAELGLKRLISEAVEKDYDKIAWTTGSQQAKRYSLEKELDTIVYNKNSGYITGTKDSDEVVFKKVASDEEVEALMGKELTKRLIDPKNSTRDEIYVLQGDALKFGGDGMKAFYDQIVPNAVKKLFKKYKVKPKMEELDEIEEMVWSIDITPEMKADIKSHGQPLYMKGSEELAGGAVVGVEFDEDGNISGIDIEKFMAGAIGGHVISKALKKEKRGIYNVTHNGKNSTKLRKYDLEALDDYIKYEKGHEDLVTKKGYGAVHIEKHLEAGSNGAVTDEELLKMGEMIRDMDYFIQDGKRVYEKNENGIRYRVIVGDSKNNERIISFYSNKKEGRVRK